MNSTSNIITTPNPAVRILHKESAHTEATATTAAVQPSFCINQLPATRLFFPVRNINQAQSHALPQGPAATLSSPAEFGTTSRHRSVLSFP